MCKTISNLSRDNSRQIFKDANLSYSDIGSEELIQLQAILKAELGAFVNNSSRIIFRMSLNKLRKRDYSFDPESKAVKKYYFHVKGLIKGQGMHFTEREAISFNPDGFIGFAGWASDENVTPFLIAFNKWVEQVAKVKQHINS